MNVQKIIFSLMLVLGFSNFRINSGISVINKSSYDLSVTPMVHIFGDGRFDGWRELKTKALKKGESLIFFEDYKGNVFLYALVFCDGKNTKQVLFEYVFDKEKHNYSFELSDNDFNDYPWPGKKLKIKEEN